MNHLLEPTNGRMWAAVYRAIKTQSDVPSRALVSSKGTERMVQAREGVLEGLLWFPKKLVVSFFVPQELVTPYWRQTKKCVNLFFFFACCMRSS